MDWYEFLLFLHILAAAVYIGSGVAIWVISQRILAVQPAAFGPFAIQAGWWAGRAHPAAAVLLLLAGFGMIADADLGFDTWIILGLVGWLAAGFVGGNLIGATGRKLEAALNGGDEGEVRGLADKLLLYARIETGILILVVADMIAKPG